MRKFLPGLALAWLVATAPTQDPVVARPVLRLVREVVLRDGASVAVAWSHDARWLASAGECGDLLLVDAERAAVVHSIVPSTGPIGRLAFAPHAPLLAVAAVDISVWSLPEVRCVGRWPKPASHALAWQANGRWLAFAGAKSTVHLVDTATMQVLREVSFGFGEALSLALSPDGDRLAVGTTDGRRLVVELPSGELLETRHCQTPVIGVGWTADGRLLHANFGELYGHHPAGGPVRFGIEAHGIELLRGGALVLAQGRGPQAVLCPDARTPELVSAPGPIAFTTDGGRRAFAAEGELWFEAASAAGRTSLEMRDGQPHFTDRDDWRHVPLPHRGPVPPCWLTADGRFLLLTRADHHIDLLDLDAEATAPRRLSVRGPIIAAVGGDEFVTAARTPIMGVWLEFWSATDLAQGGHTRRERRTLAPASAGASPGDEPWPTFSPDGRWFSFGGRGYDRRGDRIVWRQPLRFGQHTLVGNDGQQVVAFGYGPSKAAYPGAIEVRHADGSVQATLGVSGGTKVVLSPDSQRLLVQARNLPKVLSLPTLEVVAELPAAGCEAVWLDGEHVLLAPAGTPAVELHGGNCVVQRLELSQPVQQLVAAGAAGRVVAALRDRIAVLQVAR